MRSFRTAAIVATAVGLLTLPVQASAEDAGETTISRYLAGWTLSTYAAELPDMRLETSFRVPRIRTCPDDDPSVELEVAQHGARDALLVGIVARCLDGKVEYDGTIGGYRSNDPLPPIRRGDLIAVRTSHDGDGGQVEVENVTRSWRVSDLTLVGDIRYTDVMVTRMHKDELDQSAPRPLADFGRVRFVRTTVGGETLDTFGSQSHDVDMADSGTFLARTTDIRESGDFTVRWFAARPE